MWYAFFLAALCGKTKTLNRCAFYDFFKKIRKCTSIQNTFWQRKLLRGVLESVYATERISNVVKNQKDACQSVLSSGVKNTRVF